MDNLKVVCIGGGTGLSTLLTGIKHLARDALGRRIHLGNLTAIVTVSDDGGSSGRIRDQVETPAPGDIRNCLVALARDESLMTELFRYRFRGQGDLKDHSLGNLLLAALTDITGDFQLAVQLSSQVLAIEGRILPSTTSNVTLVARLRDGRQVSGESRITGAGGVIDRVWLEPAGEPLTAALDAIRQADVLTLGPGSLFTSLIPTLLVPGFVDTILASGAFKLYVANIMTQPGETLGFTQADHLRSLQKHCNGKNLFDSVLLNNAAIPESHLQRYRKLESQPIEYDEAGLGQLGLGWQLFPLVRESYPVRHDPLRLAEAVLMAYERRDS